MLPWVGMGNQVAQETSQSSHPVEEHSTQKSLLHSSSFLRAPTDSSLFEHTLRGTQIQLPQAERPQPGERWSIPPTPPPPCTAPLPWPRFLPLYIPTQPLTLTSPFKVFLVISSTSRFPCPSVWMSRSLEPISDLPRARPGCSQTDVL